MMAGVAGRFRPMITTLPVDAIGCCHNQRVWSAAPPIKTNAKHELGECRMVRTVRFSSGFRLGVAVLAASVTVGLMMAGGPASAQTVEVDIGDVIVQGEVGSSQRIGSAAVDAELVGRSCEVTATVTNQASAYEDNVLVVTSGDTRVEIPGIEADIDGVTVAGGTLTLGDTIEVDIVLGALGVSSLGSSLSVTCEPLSPTPPPPAVKGEPPYTG